ncbi:MAG TPA: hypothetical protein ENI15_08835 [Spirochaetes bacterium]|nr:hypothetical protein [Spirochaetota bacterium]
MDKELLFELIEEYDLKAIKLGTENEETPFENIKYMKDYVSEMLPIYVSIGGVNAKNDMNTLFKIGIRCFAAPMVESAYGMISFLKGLREISGDTYFLVKKCITLETITAYHNFGNIIQTPIFKELDEIIIDRRDFSNSIERDTEDPSVYSMISLMASRLKRTGKTITISGNIDPLNSVEIIQRMVPDRIDTGMFIIGSTDRNKVWIGVKKCLTLEKEMLIKMNKNCNYRAGLLGSLIQNVDYRLSKLPEKTTHVKIVDKIIN